MLVGNLVRFLGEAQILHPLPARRQAGAGRALAPVGEHKMDVSCCLSMSPRHVSVTHVAALLQNKEAEQVHLQAGWAA